MYQARIKLFRASVIIAQRTRFLLAKLQGQKVKRESPIIALAFMLEYGRLDCVPIGRYRPIAQKSVPSKGTPALSGPIASFY